MSRHTADADLGACMPPIHKQDHAAAVVVVLVTDLND